MNTIKNKPKKKGDYDLNITSSKMVNTMEKSNISPHPKYNARILVISAPRIFYEAIFMVL